MTKSGKIAAGSVGEGEQRDALELLEDDPRLHVREVERDPGADAELGAQEEALLELLELAAREDEDDLVDHLVLQDLWQIVGVAEDGQTGDGFGRAAVGSDKAEQLEAPVRVVLDDPGDLFRSGS